MSQNEKLKKLLSEPDTVDFIIRRSDYFEDFLKEETGIVVAQTIGGRYALCYASQEDFRNAIQALGTNYINSVSIVLGLLDRASLEASGIIQVQNQPYLDLRGQGVLIGFVDTGIDYTLDTFRYEDGSSKILSIYDQTGDGNPPKGFFLGTEYTNEQINEALRSENPLDIVPEQDTAGHGTFLASVAAGRNVSGYAGAAPDSEIIAVKVRKARPFYLELFSVPKQQENAFESSAVMLGIEYILNKAREVNRPVVICIGLGSNFGSHDGYNIFGEYLSGISNLKGVCVCIAAGNESEARHHMLGTIPTKGATQNIDIKVGESAGDMIISIWNTVSDRISVSVRSPTGELVNRVPAKPDFRQSTDLVLEKSTVQIRYYFPMEGSGSQLTVVRLINSTPGVWTIIVHGDIILDGTFQAWLPMTGFVDPSVEFLASNPNFTVTTPATTIGLICCGAYDNKQNSLYRKSSWGPNRVNELVPDLAAPGVGVSGYYPYGLGTMDGTSVATAITSGASALMLQWGIVEGNDVALSTYQIRAYLVRGCNRSEGMIYPNTQWGYGTLNLIQSFQLMRET